LSAMNYQIIVMKQDEVISGGGSGIQIFMP
jgi:hypothetical protein